MRGWHIFFLISATFFSSFAAAEEKEKSALPNTVYIEDMTWKEIAAAIKAAKTTIIIPTGGTEQNGPHMVTGKHNYIVRYTAGEIAKKLGNALVAPVIAYVPEGAINPPEGHMKFPGTVSLSEGHFANVLEDAARSFKQHGFKLICFLGDSGGNQNAQQQVAEKLSQDWQNEYVRVLQVGDYYANNGQDAWFRDQGENEANVGTHAGLADTSELMFANPRGIRKSLLAFNSQNEREQSGADGDASRASPKIGKTLLELKINAAVNQIKEAEAVSKGTSY